MGVFTKIFHLTGIDGPGCCVEEKDTFKGFGDILGQNGIKVGTIDFKGTAEGPQFCVYMADFPVRRIFQKYVHQAQPRLLIIDKGNIIDWNTESIEVFRIPFPAQLISHIYSQRPDIFILQFTFERIGGNRLDSPIRGLMNFRFRINAENPALGIFNPHILGQIIKTRIQKGRLFLRQINVFGNFKR